MNLFRRLRPEPVDTVLDGLDPADDEVRALLADVQALAEVSVEPTAELAELFAAGHAPVAAHDDAVGVEGATTATRRWVRRVAAPVVGVGLVGSLGIGAAAADVLPARVQDVVASVVGAVTPFELPRSAGRPVADEAVELAPQPADTPSETGSTLPLDRPVTVPPVGPDGTTSSDGVDIPEGEVPTEESRTEPAPVAPTPDRDTTGPDRPAPTGEPSERDRGSEADEQPEESREDDVRDSQGDRPTSTPTASPADPGPQEPEQAPEQAPEGPPPSEQSARGGADGSADTGPADAPTEERDADGRTSSPSDPSPTPPDEPTPSTRG